MKKIKANLKFFLSRVDHSTQLTAVSLIVMLLSILIVGLIRGSVAGYIQAILIIISLILFVYLFLLLGEKAGKYTNNLQYRIDRGTDNSFVEYPLGILLYDTDKQVQWVNPYFVEETGFNPSNSMTIGDISSELSSLIDDEEHAGNKTIQIDDKYYLVQVQTELKVIYLMDITHYSKIEKRYEGNCSVIGQVYLDNYAEITQSMSDRDISNLDNYITNELSNWASEQQMFLKRIDDDHFFIMAYTGKIFDMEKNGFKILDVIREYTSQQNVPLTLSMGFSYGVDDLHKLNDEAQKNLNLALGRGGDQVVVKEIGEKARFYGGNTDPMEKRTRVRARMISEALQELLKDSDQVIVMGHSHPDMDVLGSSLGIRRIAMMNNTSCKIVINPNTLHSDVSRLLGMIDEDPDIKKDIISPAESEEIKTPKTLIVMVDHSKQSISINPDLFRGDNNKVVVIDHHRRGEEFPENPMLIYIEPYASSTSELITEMLEYQPKNKKAIEKIEATALLAGITVDTKSFSLRTGTRTFDAASYLRSVGADEAVIQNVLKENIDSFIQKSHLIETITMINGNMAVCFGEEDKSYDPVIVAQAADTLLSLDNVEASFVISKRPDGRVGISARSLGNVNVQVIMEKLGGGGHLSDAATQISDSTVEDVKNQLIAVLTDSKKKS
ncbi:nucleotide-binding phosphoesterase [Companilactobacillus mindensis DSM 14500]|uniref:Cyclic-di-AMP phosphodiesterase n=1 Tax=Companilactobacillus mindensis DSM 14500 TaxID=1423770 RepID=A0A0R1QLL3_9LACO|nr:DHH family phosphoesterase [Companilactobacillus mindensis]KRL45647.1 nucleotide-binding phosphoesterase [Companilactobacillus mindensis DSM 14500]GEO78333.1 DHH family phosphoesterase [Companilactobacillus mindensis]